MGSLQPREEILGEELSEVLDGLGGPVVEVEPVDVVGGLRSNCPSEKSILLSSLPSACANAAAFTAAWESTGLDE